MTRQEAWVTFVSQMLTKANWRDSFDMKALLEIADKMTEEFSKRYPDREPAE